MAIKKVSLIGVGALGILFGHQLSQKLPAPDFRVIADVSRQRRYEAEGLFVNGMRCSFNFVPPEASADPADLILIAVKYSGLKDAIDAIRHHVGPDTVILSLLNGISSEAIIGQTYGAHRLPLCVAQGMDAVKEGSALTYHSPGKLVIGDRTPGSISDATAAVERFFTDIGIAHEISTHMQKHQWSKFMFNTGLNQTAAVYGSNYGGLQEEGPLRSMMLGAMEEVIVLSQRENIGLTQEDIGYWMQVLATMNPQGKPSMQQDVEACRPTEVALFGGTVLELAKKHGVDVPINTMLVHLLKELERSTK